MDALIAKANATKKRKSFRSSDSTKKPKDSTTADRTLQSVTKHTSVPGSFNKLPDAPETYKHIANKKLRAELNRHTAQTSRAKTLLEDADMLLMNEGGKMEIEGEMERTWRVGQEEIVGSAGLEAAKGRREWKLEGGPYRVRYTRNGRHLAIAGRTGHVATFDWMAGTLHSELQLQETCRDITFLHDHSHYAVAQKKYTFIYDRDGVELHCLKSHIETTRLEFLPYHWLLASIGNAGYLKYQDTSTGQLLCEHRTKLGSCTTMAQNIHNAVIYLGHQNGCITLWTPNLPHPAVQVLSHLGPVVSVSVDPSQGGRYMATAGKDGTVKVWDCRNWKGTVREWNVRSAGDVELEWSAKGALAVANGGNVNVYMRPSIHTPLVAKSSPPLYLTHPIPSKPLTSVRFTPFQDVLTIGHAAGLSSILIPGSGEANFDSAEADPFENRKARREKEVKALLDKIQPDMITLDPEFVGSLAPPSKLTTETTFDGKPEVEIPYARLPRVERLKVAGKMDETEVEGYKDNNRDQEGEGDEKVSSGRLSQSKAEMEKKKMRGKGKSLKRYLRKQRKNVIDPRAVAIRAKVEKQRAERHKARLVAKNGDVEPRKPSALDRFKSAT